MSCHLLSDSETCDHVDLEAHLLAEQVKSLTVDGLVESVLLGNVEFDRLET